MGNLLRDLSDAQAKYQSEGDLLDAALAKARRKSTARDKTAISLFSGGGGLDIGIEAAGYKTLACIEKDENACATLASNQPKYFRHAKIIHGDVDAINLTSLKRELGLRTGELDLLFGGPPCQTFSQIGKKQSLNDVRGALLFTMVKYAKELRPKAVIIENVKALATAPNLRGERGGVVRDLSKALERIGYTVSMQVLNAADFGVAQNRKRLFIVALRGGKPFEFPSAFVHKLDYSTVGTAISKLPPPATKGSEPKFPNHVDITPDGDRHRISFVAEGEYLAKTFSAPAAVRGRLSPKDTTKFLRLGRTKQSNTLRCGEIFFHPLKDRYLTPREYMRIHGFPDDYVLQGPIRGRSGSVRNLDQHRQVANSVPPVVGLAVARAIDEHLKRN